MKAFKQINLNFENRLVIIYAAILSFVCSLIVLNPLFGQEQKNADSNRPEVKIDVQKEFDEYGKITGYDSTYTWFWSGNEITEMNLDSIFENFEEDFGDWEDYFNRHHYQPFGQYQHPDWQWKETDSLLHSSLNDLFDKEFMDSFDFNTRNFPFYDSTISSYFDFEEFSQQFNEGQNDYLDRLKKYQEEHQKLIEKYFGEPFPEDDKKIDTKQQKYIPIKISPNHTERV